MGSLGLGFEPVSPALQADSSLLALPEVGMRGPYSGVSQLRLEELLTFLFLVRKRRPEPPIYPGSTVDTTLRSPVLPGIGRVGPHLRWDFCGSHAVLATAEYLLPRLKPYRIMTTLLPYFYYNFFFLI